MLFTSCYTQESQCYFYSSWQKQLFMDAWQKGREKRGCGQELQCPERDSAAASPRCKRNKQLSPSPPLRRFHKLIAYYVPCQGEIRVFFLFLALFLCHILENILRQIPHAGICIWTWLSLATQNTWNWTLQGSHNSIFTIFTVTRETWKMLIWCWYGKKVWELLKIYIKLNFIDMQALVLKRMGLNHMSHTACCPSESEMFHLSNY